MGDFLGLQVELLEDSMNQGVTQILKAARKLIVVLSNLENKRIKL